MSAKEGHNYAPEGKTAISGGETRRICFRRGVF